MSRRQNNQNKLLVEGKDDQYAIAELMAHFVHWGDSKNEWPVLIKPLDGVENLINHATITANLKGSAVRYGIVVDANDQFDKRWSRLREYASEEFPGLPERLPDNGLVFRNGRGNRLGIWIMPDNQGDGMLETFLKYLVPDPYADLWKHAQSAVERARALGAKCKKTHLEKAQIHTWLAWQDPPGDPFGTALKRNVFRTDHNLALLFVDWFCKLFELERTDQDST